MGRREAAESGIVFNVGILVYPLAYHHYQWVK